MPEFDSSVNSDADHASCTDTKKLGSTSRFVQNITSDEFSFLTACGGVMGIVESVAPSLLFIITYLLTDNIFTSIVASVAICAIFAVVKLFRKTSFQQILFGLAGVCVCSFWVYKTGQAVDFFAFGLWTNFIYLVVLLLSLAFRTPFIGILVDTSFTQNFAWRKDKYKYKVYHTVTLCWIAMFALRLVVKTPLYMYSLLVPLATAHIILSVPLYMFVLYTSWMLLKPIIIDLYKQSNFSKHN